jgi:post-segregation antitoxin (ccd killing protein)
MNAAEDQFPKPNAVPTVACSRFGVADEEKAAYTADWAKKYADQITNLNEMVEKEGLWSDELRLF